MAELLRKGLIVFGPDHSTQPTGKYLLKENMTEAFPSLLYFGGSADDYFTSIGLAFPDYPKPVEVAEEILYCGAHKKDSTVLDFFAGSGTAGHAVVSLNRRDGGSRKYILVEMGEYFDTVLKPRLQKAVFSENWKDGVPEPLASPKDANNPCNGVSHILKVLRLESYEDALDNIEFDTAAAPGAELGLDFLRDYELRYALDWESKDCPTRLAVERLDAPLDYTLTLRRETGTVTVKPDLPETFAYLVGLHTRRRFRAERDGVAYLIYTGALHEDGAEAAVLWRTCRGWTEADLKAEMDWWREQRETLAPGGDARFRERRLRHRGPP
jgi:adenine-specific DNA-methyltransferase